MKEWGRIQTKRGSKTQSSLVNESYLSQLEAGNVISRRFQISRQ